MSITVKFIELAITGELFEYKPAYPDPDFVEARKIYLTEQAIGFCPPTGKSSAKKMKGVALGGARAELDNFVIGGQIEEDINIKWLNPRSDFVWAIRVRLPPKKQTRLLGWFAFPDAFIGVHWDFRDAFGVYGSDEWANAIRKVVKKRNRFINSGELYKGRKFSDFITVNGIPKHG